MPQSAGHRPGRDSQLSHQGDTRSWPRARKARRGRLEELGHHLAGHVPQVRPHVTTSAERGRRETHNHEALDDRRPQQRDRHRLEADPDAETRQGRAAPQQRAATTRAERPALSDDAPRELGRLFAMGCRAPSLEDESGLRGEIKHTVYILCAMAGMVDAEVPRWSSATDP